MTVLFIACYFVVQRPAGAYIWAGSATVNPINPKMVALGPTFCRSLPVEASVIENRKIRVYIHVYSDSN
jgi:hypothetical protein